LCAWTSLPCTMILLHLTYMSLLNFHIQFLLFEWKPAIIASYIYRWCTCIRPRKVTISGILIVLWLCRWKFCQYTFFFPANPLVDRCDH
jgi:hypothetical protein